MFSYGMVLYELLSGQRPVLGQHQLQIAKKLSKGIRPVLGQPEEVQLYRMQALMMECWDTKPEKVRDKPQHQCSLIVQLQGSGRPLHREEQGSVLVQQNSSVAYLPLLLL